MRGLSFYICIGKWAGFGIEVSKSTLRLTLGWLAIAVVNQDIERLLNESLKVIKKLIEDDK